MYVYKTKILKKDQDSLLNSLRHKTKHWQNAGKHCTGQLIKDEFIL